MARLPRNLRKEIPRYYGIKDVIGDTTEYLYSILPTNIPKDSVEILKNSIWANLYDVEVYQPISETRVMKKFGVGHLYVRYIPKEGYNKGYKSVICFDGSYRVIYKNTFTLYEVDSLCEENVYELCDVYSHNKDSLVVMYYDSIYNKRSANNDKIIPFSHDTISIRR